MDARHEQRSLLLVRPRGSSSGALPDKGEPIEGAVRECADRHSPAPDDLTDSEADPRGFSKKPAERGARGVMDDDLVGVHDWNPGLLASPPEFVVAARLQMLVELADEAEDLPLHEKIGRRGEALLDVSVLPEKPARVHPFGDGRVARELELNPPRNPGRGAQRRETLLQPVVGGPAIDVGERHVLGQPPL